MNNKTIIYFVIPVFNDWESFKHLVSEIDNEFKNDDTYLTIIYAINDGSTEYPKKGTFNHKNIKKIDLIRNVGHQRAIAIGLQYLYHNEDLKKKYYVVVMDADGEDRPKDVKSLIMASSNKVVFAKRVKRSEGLIFRTGYYFYKLLYRLLTGMEINYGNFSVIPSSLMDKIIVLPNLWNHYACSITASKIPYIEYPTARGKRYFGSSKMNFRSLIIHGFSAISVHFDILCYRILKFSFIAFLFSMIGIGIILYKKFFTHTAIPGWASSLIMIAMSIIVQLFSVTFIILLLQLSSRKKVEIPDVNRYKIFLFD